MTPTELSSRIESGAAELAVVGLGYVGLPLACVLSEAGFRVRGVDSNGERAALIDAGTSPIEGDEPGLAQLLTAGHLSGRLTATTDFGALAESDVWFVCVDTPVDPLDHLPRFQALRAACAAIGRVIKDGALVVVESTVAPGTIDGVVKPALSAASGREAGVGFMVGHCPERVMPGRLLQNMRTMSRVVGGQTAEVAEIMRVLYSTFVGGDLDLTDCTTAELVKTAENAYRDVNIAFANELAIICESVGGDVWRVRDLVNKSPGRNVLLPGGGVGGHCIPKDPWLLAAPVARLSGAPLLKAARAVNDSMPSHVAGLVARLLAAADRSANGPRVIVLGYTYLENSDDVRNSPSQVLVQELRSAGCLVGVHDPYLEEYAGDPMERLKGADCAVLMVSHRAYRQLDLVAAAATMRTALLVDARGFFDPVALDAAGFQHRRLGTAP